jgi:cytochrome c5
MMHKRHLIAAVLLIFCAAAAQRSAVRTASGSGDPIPSKKHEIAVAPPTPAANLATAKRMPNGIGKEVVVSKCGTCHALSVVTRDRKTHDQWIETISTMSAKGLQASEDEMFTVLQYLDRYYGPRTSAKSPKPAH